MWLSFEFPSDGFWFLCDRKQSFAKEGFRLEECGKERIISYYGIEILPILCGFRLGLRIKLT